MDTLRSTAGECHRGPEPCHQEQAGGGGAWDTSSCAPGGSAAPPPPPPQAGASGRRDEASPWCRPVGGGGGPRKPGGDLQGRVAAKVPLWAPRAAPGVFLTGLLSFSVGSFARRGRAGSWPPSLCVSSLRSRTMSLRSSAFQERELSSPPSKPTRNPHLPHCFPSSR